MPAPYSAGSIFLQVVPSFRGVPEQIAREARNWGDQAGKNYDEAFEKHATDSAKRAGDKAGKELEDSSTKAGDKAGKAYAGRFETAVKQAVARASREVGTIKLDADDTAAQRKLNTLKKGLAALDKQKIGVDINAAGAFAKLTAVEEGLREIQDRAGSIDARVNAAGALGEVAKIRSELMALSAIQIEPDIKIDRQMGAFERGFKQAVEHALRDLGSVNLPVDPRLGNAGQRAVADLRQKLFNLGDMQIGVDISAETAREHLAQIRDDLERLQHEHWSVDLDVNAAGAEANLATFLAVLDEVDRKDVSIDVKVHDAVSTLTLLNGLEGQSNRTREAARGMNNTFGQDGANSFRAFNARVLGVAALGPLVVPAIGAIGGAVAGLAPMAVAGAAGIGVLVLGLYGMATAFKALTAVQQNSETDMQTYSKATENAARQVRDAQQSLADAKEQAARAAEDSAARIQDADRGVASAERGLADAQKQVQRAQEDLTKARAEAAQQLEDLQLQVRGNALDQRQAVLDLHQAQKDLADAQKAGVTGDELEALQIAYDRAALRIDQTKETQQQLTAEQEKWAKTGVEGSDRVVQAQDRLQAAQEGVLSAQQQVADAERAAATARRDAARQAVDSSKAVAKAQQGVTDALDNYSDALSKTSSAQQKLDQAMQNLSPTGRAFVNWLDSLRPRFQALRDEASSGFLPGLAAWIDSIVNRGPQIERVIGSIATGFGDMFARFGTSLNGNAFSQLFDMIDRAGPRFIAYMGSTLINLGEGVASLVSALEPLGDIVGVWMIQMTRAFREWAASLSGTRALQEFIDYVQRIGPKVGAFFYQLWQALVNIGKAVAPFAEGLLDKLTAVLAFIADMDPAQLRIITLGIVALTLALQAIFGLTALAKSFQSALRITNELLGTMGSKGAAIAAAGGQLGLFAVAFTVLYSQSSLARDVINDIVGALVDLGKWIASALPDLRSFATVLGIVVAAWKVFDVIGTGLGAIGNKITNLAPAAGVLAANLLGSDSAGSKVMTTMGKFGNILSKVGGVLPLVGIGLGIVAGGMEEARRQTQAEIEQLTNWIKLSHEGGAAGIDAGKKLQDYKNKIKDAQDQLDSLTQSMTHGNAASRFAGAGAQKLAADITKQKDEVKKATDAYNEWWKSLTPIEQAQATLQAAQNDLSYAVEHYGARSKEAQTASENYTAAQNALKQIQYDVAAATSGLNQQLGDQLQLMISLADAELGYEEAVANLDDAHQRTADALAKYTADSKEYRDALRAEERQMSSTAEAAQRVMEQRYQNADATTRQAMGEAAYYLELERQKKAYGELPPRLEEIRASLERNIDPTVLAAAKFYDLGVKINSVPNSKTIVLDSSTTDDAIQKMTDLGLHVERLPDGTVKVTADTEEAQGLIDELLKPKTLDVTVAVSNWGPGSDLFKSHENTDRPGGSAPGAATGGAIIGPGSGTSDSIPIWVSNGEYVVRSASVAKYGLGLLDAINRGTFDGGYRLGGPVGPRIKGGRQAFAGGGSVGSATANWGGTITFSGGALNPLAAMWFDALQQISDLSASASDIMSQTFDRLRDNAVKSFADMRTGTTGHWGGMIGAILQGGFGLAGSLAQLFTGIHDDTTSKVDRTRGDVGGLFGRLRDESVATITSALHSLFTLWGTLPTGLLTPVNMIIDKVLNNGLFKAFNAIVGALGLDAKLNIPHVDPAKLAAGGTVPGWSPHDKADNIPAMLTAGEFVQPVSAVDYYGPEFMDMLRKRQIPREALGIRRYATGGWVAMENVIRGQFPWARFTSAYRPGDPGYHGKGQAIDIAGATQYPDPRAIAQMLEINRWIAGHFSNITELIHTGAGAINLWHGQPHVYNAATQAEHRNHVHWAMANGLTPGSSLLGDLANLLGVGADLISDPAGFLRGVVDGALGGFDSDGTPVKRIMAEGVRKVTGFVVDKVTGFLASAFGAGDSSFDFSKTMAGDVAQQVQQVFAHYGWGAGQQWADAAWVIQHESGFNPHAQNPSSSASGLGQFIDGTWRAYRPAAAAGFAHMKDAPVAMQADATARYMRDRYTSPSGAKAFWVGHHYYGEGGPVQDVDSATGAIVPDLHDTGGWLMPGLNVIMNRTNRPEPTINPQTLDALQTIAATGGGEGGDKYYLGVMQGATAKQVVGELNHAKTVASRGGKYGGR